MGSLPFTIEAALAAQSASPAIIDGHIHLFDKTRPGGSPYPPDPPPGKAPDQGWSALPARYRSVVKPFGVVGTVVVEASPLVEDNQWLLDQAAADSIIVGVVGYLDPGSPDFGTHLERFRKNTLYRGIRHRQTGANVSLAEGIQQPQFMANLKLLADAGLSLDTYSRQQTTDSSTVLVRIADKVPSLRIIVDHLPGVRLPEERADHDAFVAGLAELGKRPQVYIKLSEVVRSVNGQVSTDLSIYRDWLDKLWTPFGEDHVLYGSDWPNSESVEPNSYPNIMNVARAYVTGKGVAAVKKVFSQNSAAAYGVLGRWGGPAVGWPITAIPLTGPV